MNPNVLWEKALKAAVAAGEEILDVYGGTIAVDFKDDRTPLTEADRRAHARIAEILRPSGVPVLSEEGRSIPYEERRGWSRLWIVDPLDGTKEFIKRNGEFTVNIALVESGNPVLGVVLAPALGRLYGGCQGRGSFKLEMEAEKLLSLAARDSFLEVFLKLSAKLPLEKQGDRPFTAVASRSHMSPETTAYIDTLRAGHPDLSLASIGSSLKFCLVAEGEADIYPRFGPTMEWDTAAGHAVAVFSGARVVESASGAPLAYNKPDLLNPWFIVTVASSSSERTGFNPQT